MGWGCGGAHHAVTSENRLSAHGKAGDSLPEAPNRITLVPQQFFRSTSM
jgi:hypothetical protein